MDSGGTGGDGGCGGGGGGGYGGDMLKVLIITWRFWLPFQHAMYQSVGCSDMLASLEGLEQKLEIQMRRSALYDRQEDVSIA